MPQYDTVQYNQKWSMYDTWSSAIGRRLRVAVITTQYRLIKIMTAQNRLLKIITAQYRRVIGQTGG